MLNDLRNDIPNERASECPASLVAFLALPLSELEEGGRASSLPKLSQAPEVAEHLPAGYELEHHVQVGIVLLSRRRCGEGGGREETGMSKLGMPRDPTSVSARRGQKTAA